MHFPHITAQFVAVRTYLLRGTTKYGYGDTVEAAIADSRRSDAYRSSMVEVFAKTDETEVIRGRLNHLYARYPLETVSTGSWPA